MTKPAFLSLLLACLLLILATSPLNPLWPTPATAPLQAVITGTTRPLAAFVSWLASIPKLAHQRDQLAAERNQLLAQVAKLQAVDRQNAFLRQEISLDQPKFPHLTIARTAGTIQDGSATYLLLTSGSKNGLKNNQVVVANGILIGKIIRLTGSTALVQLPQSLGSAIPAILYYPDGTTTKGLVQGNFNLSATLDQVLPSEKLQPGTVITTSNDGNLYPPDIVIGKVGHLTSTPNQPFQSATVDLPWNIANLEYVAIIS